MSSSQKEAANVQKDTAFKFFNDTEAALKNIKKRRY